MTAVRHFPHAQRTRARAVRTRLDPRLLVPDPDERRCFGNHGPLGAVELVEIEHALSCGERSRATIAHDFGVNERTIERIAARMKAAGLRVRSMAEDLRPSHRSGSRVGTPSGGGHEQPVF